MSPARRDAKRVPFVASRGMTEIEYREAIYAHRTMGRIEIHQQFRALAIELGLPPDCSEIPRQQKRRLPRWVEDGLSKAERQIWAGLRIRAHVAMSLPRSGDPVSLKGITVA